MSETKKVRYGVVGLGWFAQIAVLPAFEHAGENSELVALFSSDAEKLTELGERHRVAGRYEYEDLARAIDGEGIDALYLVVPNHLHRDFTERAAGAGVHVLCEKPMAVTEEECRAMIEATERAGVRLMIAYRLHFEEANLRAIQRVEWGDIGEPRLFEAVFANRVTDRDNIRLGPVARGGGAFYDIGIYCLNAARYVFRAEPEEVSAFTTAGSRELCADCDETSVAILRFPGERLATISCTFGAADHDHFAVYGREGSLRVEPAFSLSADLGHRLSRGDEVEERRFLARDQVAPEILHFSRSILGDRAPEPSGREGLADVRVLEALHRSAAEGRAIRLEPFDPGRRPDLGQELRRPPVAEQDLVATDAPS